MYGTYMHVLVYVKCDSLYIHMPYWDALYKCLSLIINKWRLCNAALALRDAMEFQLLGKYTSIKFIQSTLARSISLNTYIKVQ